MDQNPATHYPVDMSLIAQTHQNFSTPIESGGGAVHFLPNAECSSFKKPRTSQIPMNSRIPVLFNTSTLGIPNKTVLCLQFQRGHCTYGDNCHFAHGIGDTQKLLPRRQELVKQESWNEDQRIIAAMKLCRRFCNGEQCPFGERCHFLHEGPAKFRKSFAVSIGTTGPGGFSSNDSDQLGSKTSVQESLDAIQVSHKPVMWKTRLCNKWETTGNCPFGSNCYFAHGHAELKKLGSQTAMEFGDVCTSKMIRTAAMHASPSTRGNGTACGKKMQTKKCLYKWKRFQKITGIYADWIDDMPLVHSSLG